MAMPRPPLPAHAVATLFLERQHLAAPRVTALTPKRLLRFAEDVGGIQLDSINVLERAHYLTVWSRFGPYERARLDRLVYRRRLLFEYWAHAACLVPTSTLPWWRRAMLDYRTHHTGWSGWLRRNKQVVASVQAAVLANGPMANGDFEGKRRGAAGGWWNWQPVQHALHYLWMTGALTVHSRQHFQKRFDLLERALPGVRDVAAVSAEEFARWHVERSLHAMGAATEQDLAGYLTFPRGMSVARRAALRAMLARGEITEIEVEGSTARWLALTRDRPALARARRRQARGTTLLSPFDSLLLFRARVARLFGFDYRIEVYTPGPQRVHGYYTLPILHDGRLIGRVDAKSHRAERRLEIRHVHFEPWFADGAAPPMGGERVDQDAAAAGLVDALGSLAVFVGGDEIVLRRVTPHRMKSPLARALRVTPPPAPRPRGSPARRSSPPSARPSPGPSPAPRSTR
ncbi:MAG: YcaQ family DNA glycosylase [Candidatus Rokubacteria bacterium]|nr:YcaQ family DNA glycosylase [Candidatus Rokubacteria bacterium]